MNKSGFGTIIQIGDILVSEDVIFECFECDYEACRGACCVIGDSGAPMDEDEDGLLERQYPIFSNLMNEEGREAVRRNGFFIIDRDGDMVTPLISGGGDIPAGTCAFCRFEAGPGSAAAPGVPDGASAAPGVPAGQSCRCAIEKAGGVKPRSCSLYPIRVTHLTGGGQALNLHRWDICKCAFEKGARSGVRVYEFLRKPLEEIYGSEFWKALDIARHKLTSNN